MKLSDKIAGWALIFSLAAIFLTAIQFFHSNKLEYKINSMEYHPQLQVSEIRLTSWEWNARNVPVIRKDTSDSDTLTINAKMSIDFNLNIVNVGNTKAELQLLILADTTSGGPFLKDILPDLKRRVIEKDSLYEYYNRYEFNLSDTVELNLTHEIQFITDQYFTLHFYFIYKNELSQYFDSYYWARFNTEEVIFENVYNTVNHRFGIRAKSDEIQNMIQFFDDYNSSSVITKRESHKLKRILDSIAER